MGRWSRRLAPDFVTFAGVRDGERILDVGAGTGTLALAVAEAHPSARVVGVDRSSSYVDFANGRAEGRAVRFFTGDARQLAFDDGAFDRTLSLLVFNFIPDAGRALAEMTRVTRSGGVVAAAVWDYGGGMEMLRIFWDEAVARDAAAEPHDERRMPLCASGELAAFWTTHGLAQVEAQPLALTMTFTSFEEYWTPFLGGQGPAGAYVAALPVEARDDLRVRLRDRLARDGTDGAITLPARAWAVRGTVSHAREISVPS